MISFDLAYELTLNEIVPLKTEQVGLLDAVGRTAAVALQAKVDSPTADVSLKDGYAVRSADVLSASAQTPVRLELIGLIPAGGDWQGAVMQGQATRILSGGRIPPGADAVLAEEFTKEEDGQVLAFADAEQGRNILQAGNDVKIGQVLGSVGTVLNPPMIGYLASAGFDQIPVITLPKVAVIATGDEVIAPGHFLGDGKLYASNLVTLAGWSRSLGCEVSTYVIPDDGEKIESQLRACIQSADIIITCGGAWKGDRDLVAKILDRLGWRKIYHRIKMGPGKAVGFGLWHGKPVFILPGGPPSNHMAFLQLALPTLQKMSGRQQLGFPLVNAATAQELRGQKDWTQFVHGKLLKDIEGSLSFHPSQEHSRLQMMSTSNAVAKIPEGIEVIAKGTTIPVQVLDQHILTSI